MEEPCDICGDVGLSFVAAQCSVCKIAREHIYCMKKLRLVPPVNWICEACETGSLISPKDGENLPNPITSPVVEPNASRYKQGNNFKTSKVQYITPGEVAKLSSGATKFESPTKCTSLSRPRPSKNVTSMAAGCSINPKGAKAAPLKFLPLSVIENSCSRSAGKLLQRHSSSPSNLLANQQQGQTSSDTREKKAYQVPRKNCLRKGQHTATRDFPAAHPVTEKKAAQFPREEYILEEHPKDTVVPSPPDTEKRTNQASKVTPSTEMVHNSNEEVVADIRMFAALRLPPPNEGFKERSRSPDTNEGAPVKILPEADSYFPIPALHPSWNGNFEILDPVCSKFNGGLRAHPPAKVLKKVHEFSKKMPKVLQFRMVSRCSIWDDIFQGDCPDAHDIGLYFFSDNRKSENYSFVLDFVEKLNIVLSCPINGVELLVFPSRFLTAESQRWCGQYFLWGVFRSVKKSTGNMKLAIIPPPSKFTCSEETDGECNADKELAIIPHTNDEELAKNTQPAECANDEELAITPHPLEFVSVKEEAIEDEDGTIDMDIDMEGGKPVGRVDIAVPREPLKWGHHGAAAAIPQGKDVSSTTPPLPKKAKLRVCTPPPGFENWGMRIKGNPPMVKPLQVDKTFIRSPPPKPSSGTTSCCDRSPAVGLMRQ